MRILPRPIGALVLVAIAAAAYGGYERLMHRHPPRVAEAPKPAAEPPMPPTPPAAVAAARAPAEPAPAEPPARMTLTQQAGFDAWAIDDRGRLEHAYGVRAAAPVTSAIFSRDGSVFAIGQSHGWSVWRTAGPERLGSLPNGSGLRFGAPRTVMAGANELAASVVWQWQSPGTNAVVWPPRYATSPIERLDPLP